MGVSVQSICGSSHGILGVLPHSARESDIFVFDLVVSNGTQVAPLAVELGRQLDIVKPGTLVVHSFIQTRLELNLHLPITLVVAVGDVHDDTVLLVLPMGETDVLRTGETLHLETDTVTCSLATVLTLVCVERLEVDHLTIEYDTEIVLVRTVPAVDLVEVKLEHQLFGICGNIEGLEGSLALVLGAVPA